EPSRNGAHGKVEPTVDHLGGGKAVFLVVPPAPERDGTDAELRPQLRAGNEIAPLEIRSLPRVFLPSQYPNFALSHVPPRNALTARERSRRTRTQRRSYIQGICSEIRDRQIPGCQAPGKRRCRQTYRRYPHHHVTRRGAGSAETLRRYNPARSLSSNRVSSWRSLRELQTPSEKCFRTRSASQP